MLKELTLRHWKSFEDATLHIDPLTVLIGTNASGKSNVVDALLFMQRVIDGIDPTQALHGTDHFPGLRGGTKWAAKQGQYIFTLSAVFDVGEITDYVYSIRAQVQANQCGVAFNTTNRQMDRLSHLDHDDRLADQQIENEVKTIFRNIFILDPIPSRMRGFSAFTDTLNPDASNIAGVMAALEANKKRELEELFKRYCQHLPEGDFQRIWAEQVGRLQEDAMLYCEEKWGGDNTKSQIIDARSMSDGTLRLLAILTALFTRPAGSLLVIEDVDSGLHPSRAGLLVQMLKEEGKKRGVDVLLTTHNPALLDALGPEMLPFITVVHRDPHSGESRLTPLEEAPQLAKLLAFGPVGRLAASGRIEEAMRNKGKVAHG
ncbi:MAG: AAA family ATPase [Magnetococcales bacterium]|nr:AAA family ATPase [Magnetococcales bacterium]